MKWIMGKNGCALNADLINSISPQPYSGYYSVNAYMQNDITYCLGDFDSYDDATKYITDLCHLLSDDVKRDIPLAALNMSPRILNALHRVGIDSLIQLKDAVCNGNISRIRGIGTAAIDEILDIINHLGMEDNAK